MCSHYKKTQTQENIITKTVLCHKIYMTTNNKNKNKLEK